MKVFHWHHQIGKAKYVVSYHDGVKKHNDGSPFFDVEICKNKVNLAKFLKKLGEEGYVEKSFSQFYDEWKKANQPNLEH
jgi:hypothetical protein